MESLSDLQIGCARNVAAPEVNLCEADYGLAELMGCSAVGTWVCCIQGQVQEQFNCLSWHRARPNKHVEPKLALHRPILGVFGGTFALPEVLTRVISREVSGSTEDQRDYWFGLSCALLSSRQALQNPSGIWALYPVREGDLRAGATWTLAWVLCGPKASSPGDCAGENRDAWSQHGSSMAKMEKGNQASRYLNRMCMELRSPECPIVFVSAAFISATQPSWWTARNPE